MKMLKRKRKLSYAQIMAVGFLLVIMAGTILLMLPCANRNGQWTHPLHALFTATSATCVTGLIVADTYQYWNLFGQILILMMVQIGGLGFISMGVMFSLFLKKRIGLANRSLIKESVNSMQLSGVVRLVTRILIGTGIFEGVGAVILAIRFIPEMGFVEGIYYGIFHSVTAFCNAGFDLMGRYAAYSSLVSYYNDPVVNITIILLIIIGGIGFIVWDELRIYKFRFRRYSLHTKIVVVSTLVLLIVPAVLFAIFENHHLMQDMSVADKIWTSLFASVTARTAGFNTIDVGGMTQASKFLTIILMFIGGSPGSTAGGVKTTTIVVIIVYIWSNLRNASGCNIFGRRIGDEVIKKSSMVIGLNLFLSVAALLIISAVQTFPTDDLMLEVFSAIGTVGLSTGITRQLNAVSQIVIIFLMYCGRIGSMTFAVSVAYKKEKSSVWYPQEDINVG